MGPRRAGLGERANTSHLMTHQRPADAPGERSVRAVFHERRTCPSVFEPGENDSWAFQSSPQRHFSSQRCSWRHRSRVQPTVWSGSRCSTQLGRRGSCSECTSASRATTAKGSPSHHLPSSDASTWAGRSFGASLERCFEHSPSRVGRPASDHRCRGTTPSSGWRFTSSRVRTPFGWFSGRSGARTSAGRSADLVMRFCSNATGFAESPRMSFRPGPTTR